MTLYYIILHCIILMMICPAGAIWTAVPPRPERQGGPSDPSSHPARGAAAARATSHSSSIFRERTRGSFEERSRGAGWLGPKHPSGDGRCAAEH